MFPVVKIRRSQLHKEEDGEDHIDYGKHHIVDDRLDLCLRRRPCVFNDAYYPSYTDLQSSLTLANSCSSEFTLKTMAYVSILVPFVLAYIFYAWRSIDRHKITEKEMDEGGHSY